MTAAEQRGECFVDACGAVFQTSLKAGAGDDSRYGDGQPENSRVQGFGYTHGDTGLSFGGTEYAEDIDQSPGSAEDAEHGGDIGDDADEGEPAAAGVDGVGESRFRQFLRRGIGGRVQDAEHDFGEGIVVLQTVFFQRTLSIGGVAEGEADLGEGAFPASADKYQVVENGRYQQNGAGEKRITEGMAGIEELTDGFRHGVMGGVMG